MTRQLHAPKVYIRDHDWDFPVTVRNELSHWYHMYNKFKVGESEMCPCNADIMTAEHLLQHCRLHDAMRRDTWPDPTLLRDKLYGNLEELRRTAAFVRATGISI